MSRSALPPGPRSPALYQLFRYSLSALPFLEGCARRYGSPFTLRLAGFGKMVMLADPEAVKEVFRGDPHVLHSGEGNEFLSVSVGSNSVLVLDEEAHDRQRRTQLPPLKGERMRSFFDAMQSETLALVQSWSPGQPVRILEPMRRITLRVILRAVLGLAAGPELDALEDKVHRLLENGRSRWSLFLMKFTPDWMVRRGTWIPFVRQLQVLDQALFPLIAARRANPGGECVLTELLAATHEDGSPLSDQEIRDGIVTLLMAGHETTSVALAWALEQILPRPDVVDRILQEIREVAGGGLPRGEHLGRLDYLDAVIRESLRVRTILPFVVRLTKRPFVAGGREYPAGVLLCPCNHLVHHREDLYPEPGRFRPERFLERKYGGHEWFPFGGGNRTCLGMAFALYEMKVVLSTLLLQVRLERPAGLRSRPLRQGITQAPDDGVRVVVGR